MAIAAFTLARLTEAGVVERSDRAVEPVARKSRTTIAHA
jgi:hypothetical protein